MQGCQRGILMDAMFTIFVALHGRWKLYRLILERYGITASEETIRGVYEEERRRKEEGRVFVDKLPRGYYRRHWSSINAALVGRLDSGRSGCEKIGEEIFLEIMGNPDHYTVREDMRAFLESAVDKYRLFIVSNQEPECLNRLLRHFGIGMFERVFVSDDAGYVKPDSRFFASVIAEIGLPLEQLAFVGNNPKNDMKGAADAGIQARFLYDPDGEHANTIVSVPFVRIRTMTEVSATF